jgi:hypothetical protein
LRSIGLTDTIPDFGTFDHPRQALMGKIAAPISPWKGVYQIQYIHASRGSRLFRNPIALEGVCCVRVSCVKIASKNKITKGVQRDVDIDWRSILWCGDPGGCAAADEPRGSCTGYG